MILKFSIFGGSGSSAGKSLSFYPTPNTDRNSFPPNPTLPVTSTPLLPHFHLQLSGTPQDIKPQTTPMYPPDVLVIVSDDQGYSDVSWNGPFPTPNLALLHEESVTLSNYYVHPTCTPTRAALFTGKVAPHSGMTGPLLLAAPCHLPDDEPTFGREMKVRMGTQFYKDIVTTIVAGERSQKTP